MLQLFHKYVVIRKKYGGTNNNAKGFILFVKQIHSVYWSNIVMFNSLAQQRLKMVRTEDFSYRQDPQKTVAE